MHLCVGFSFLFSVLFSSSRVVFGEFPNDMCPMLPGLYILFVLLLSLLLLLSVSLFVIVYLLIVY